MSYKTTSAILLLIYNRPDTTKKVLEAIRMVQPGFIYIAADAPVPGDEKQINLCTAVKNLIEGIDWSCEIKKFYPETHLGCKEAVSSAITWFFEHEEEGIILEDDCVPSEDFFRFCDSLLERYRNHARISIISGSNLQGGKKWGGASYYFSNLTHVWGWASWRRVWQQYDKELSLYDATDLALLNHLFKEPIITKAWQKKFDEVKNGIIDTWDYQFTFINFFYNKLSVIPNANLVTNIGFGEGATHTIDPASRYALIPHQELGEITHPAHIIPQTQADLATLYYDFDVERLKLKNKKWHRRLKRWFKKFAK